MASSPCRLFYRLSLPGVALFSHCFLGRFESLCTAPGVYQPAVRIKMRLLVPILLFAASASGQWIAPTAGGLLVPEQSVALPSASVPEDGAQQLLGFRDSDIKFSLPSLM